MQDQPNGATGAFWVGITPRQRAKGTVYQVVFRVGGGKYVDPIYLCTCPKKFIAEERKKFAYLELAAGRDPRVSLAAMADGLHGRSKRPGLLAQWNEFLDGRGDMADGTYKIHAIARDKFCAELGEKVVPEEITVPMLVAATKRLKGLSPATLRKYVGKLAMVLDYCDVNPNPVRSKKFTQTLPTVETEEVNPPSRHEFKRILATVPATKQAHLALRVMECLGLRSDELLQLQVQDLIFDDQAIRVSKARTKQKGRGTAKSRKLPVPTELWDGMVALLPAPEARARYQTRAVFTELYRGYLGKLMKAASEDLGIDYSPHDLRHRRCSLWLAHGFDPVRAAYWAGHAKPSMTTDVYGHVVIGRDDEWVEFWTTQYGKWGNRAFPVSDPFEADTTI